MKKQAPALLLFSATSFASPAFATLIINEVDYDQPSTDNAEFIELFNQDASSINLSAYSIDLINGNSGSSIYDSIALPSINLAAGDYFVICGDSNNVINCNLEASKSSNCLEPVITAQVPAPPSIYLLGLGLLGLARHKRNKYLH